MDTDDVIDLTEAFLQPSLGKGRSPSSDLEVMEPEAAASGAALNAAIAAETMDQDEDVLLTEEIGQAWDRDLPHMRNQCGVHRNFSRTRGTGNAAYCAKCYCFICDAEASLCKEWGTGAKMLDHCNAYDTPFYVNLKSSLKRKQAVASEQQHSASQRAASEQQARSGSTAAEGSRGAAALRAVGSLLGVSLPPVSSSPGKAKGKEAMSQQSPQPPVKLKRKRELGRDEDKEKTPGKSGKKAKAALVDPGKPHKREAEMPDPARVPGLMEIGVIRLSVKAVKAAGSIHNVSRRLLPNGLYFDSERTTMEELHGDQLSIENLCETSWSHPNSKWRPAHLKLCPLPLPDGMEEPSDMRLRQITVVRGDIPAPPQVYGVEASRDAQIKDVYGKLRTLLELPEDIRLIPFCNNHGLPV
eukprot:jgi/Astpho2/9589/Aster-x1590